jgi:hypothetical protein
MFRTTHSNVASNLLSVGDFITLWRHLQVATRNETTESAEQKTCALQ